MSTADPAMSPLTSAKSHGADATPSGVPTDIAERKAPPLGTTFKTPMWHRVAEKVITFMALSAVAAIVLIFVFIGREAAPMFWEA